MAVTVTEAAPPTATNRHWTGTEGARGSDVYIMAPDSRGERNRVTKLTLSGTYATGGFALTPADFGLKEIRGMAVIADGTSGGVAVPALTTTGASPNVKLYTDNAQTELANTTSVANFCFLVILNGI